MKTRVLVTAAIVMAAACSDATSPSDELGAARGRWEYWGHTSYDLVVRRGPCECLPQWMEAVVVSVRNGTITRYHEDDGQPVTESYLEYPSVPGLFDLIADAIAGGHTVVVKYDAQTGVPRRIDIDPQDFPVDGGSTLLVELRAPGNPPDLGN